MSTAGSKKLLVIALVWLVILGLGAAAYKLIFAPARRENLVRESSSGKRHAHQLRLAIDSFSGYGLFRSREFHDDLGARGIGLDLVDDKADYAARIQALRAGDVQLAVFTIDALIKACAGLDELPGTIVLIVDETTGADAMVAYKQAVPNIDALNRADARFVVTRDSPSETLSRVVMARFNLSALGQDCWIDAQGADDVLRRFQEASPSEPAAFVLWEPYVSKALEDRRAHVVIDSSKFRGYIVDVLVIQREFLVQDEQGDRLVKKVVEAYLRAGFERQSAEGGLVTLVQEDTLKELDEELSEQQAEGMVNGIWWKNTQENYAHLGLLPGGSAGGLQHLEEMIRNITQVLLKTGAITRDPTGGEPHKLYYDRVLASLEQEGFHPSLVAATGDQETIRAAAEAPQLSEEQWKKLAPVGELDVAPIEFARGTSRLTDKSQRELSSLAETLKSWPQYYLLVRGHARSEGDPEANRLLAEERARAAADFLIDQGVLQQRVRNVSMPPSDSGGRAQSVSFVLGQRAY